MAYTETASVTATADTTETVTVWSYVASTGIYPYHITASLYSTAGQTSTAVVQLVDSGNSTVIDQFILTDVDGKGCHFEVYYDSIYPSARVGDVILNYVSNDSNLAAGAASITISFGESFT